MGVLIGDKKTKGFNHVIICCFLLDKEILHPSWFTPQMCSKKYYAKFWSSKNIYTGDDYVKYLKVNSTFGAKNSKKNEIWCSLKKGEFSSCEKTSSNFRLWAPYVKNITPENIFSCAYIKREWEESMRLQKFTTIGEKHWAP